MQTVLSLEGCDAVFPTYENSVSSTMQYTTVALVFNMDSGLFWSITNEEEESKLSTHEDIKFLSPSLTNTSGYQMEPGLPWNQEIKPWTEAWVLPWVIGKLLTCLLFPLSCCGSVPPRGDRVCNPCFGRILMWFTSLIMIKDVVEGSIYLSGLLSPEAEWKCFLK